MAWLGAIAKAQIRATGKSRNPKTHHDMKSRPFSLAIAAGIAPIRAAKLNIRISMARPRLPAEKVNTSGADLKNPSRFEGRRAPKGLRPLGPAAIHLTPYQIRAFEWFRSELPWLKESHRALVELAATYRGNINDPDAATSLKEMQELRRCLGQLGATPADESKVTTCDGEDEDPDDAFFGRPN